ncbi:hypothetical protein G7046_g7885 [Stylonectria norvegica]|nr:hypothetical protein G7046_g7885 [Stylonectria norvegica]
MKVGVLYKKNEAPAQRLCSADLTSRDDIGRRRVTPATPFGFRASSKQPWKCEPKCRGASLTGSQPPCPRAARKGISGSAWQRVVAADGTPTSLGLLRTGTFDEKRQWAGKAGY